MLGGDLLRDLVPEHVAEARGVRLRRARDHAAPRLGLLERVAQHPLDARAGEDAHLDRDLARQRPVRPAADACVLALGVLAHEEHVDVGRAATGERAGDAFEQARRPEVRPEVEPLAEVEDQPPQRDVVGDRRVADRAHQDRVVRAHDVERVLRHHPAVLVPVGRAPRQLGPLDRNAERVDRLARLRDHLRADAVPREEGDPVRHATPARLRHGLQVRERLLERDDVRVLGLDVEQVRLVRRLSPVADALARHQRRPAVLEQIDRGRPDAAARRRAAEDHRVDLLRDEDRGEVRAEEGRRPLLQRRRSRPRGARAAGRSRPTGRRAGGRRAPAPSGATDRRPSGSARSRSS